MTTTEMTAGRSELVDALVHGYIPQGVVGLTSQLGIRGLTDVRDELPSEKTCESCLRIYTRRADA